MIDKIEQYVKKKVDQYELYYEDQNQLSMELNKNEITFVSEGESEALGVRVFVGGRLGFSFTNNLKRFEDCVDRAIKIAKMNDKDKHFKTFVPKQELKKPFLTKHNLETFYVEDYAKLHKDIISNMKNVHAGIFLSNGSYSKSEKTKNIVNSEGVNLTATSFANALSVELSMKANDKLFSNYNDFLSRDQLNSNVLNDLAQRLAFSVKKKEINSMACPIVFHPDALASLFNHSLTFAINGENVLNKKSFLADKLNKKVANTSLTILDNPLESNLFSFRRFDDEGYPTQKTNIIENGKLKNFLYDSYNAKKAGMQNTGHAARVASSLPQINPTNVIIKPGKTDVVKQVDKGVFIRQLMGVHTMNAATGDFSLNISEGYYIEKGKIKHPLQNTMVAGNLFEILKNIQAYGKIQSEAYGGEGAVITTYYMPDILVKELKIIGQN
ncbi:MAG: TldD/PmbA family protein [archaeon]